MVKYSLKILESMFCADLRCSIRHDSQLKNHSNFQKVIFFLKFLESGVSYLSNFFAYNSGHTDGGRTLVATKAPIPVNWIIFT